MSYRTQLATLQADTTKAQNVDILASDFQMKRSGTLCRVSVAMTNVALRLVPSTGTSVGLGSPSSGAMTTYEFALDPDRTWNLQTNSPSGVTVYHLCIQEVDA